MRPDPELLRIAYGRADNVMYRGTRKFWDRVADEYEALDLEQQPEAMDPTLGPPDRWSDRAPDPEGSV